MILIISDVFDTHADVVEQHLATAGADYFRLNLDESSLRKSYISSDGSRWEVEQNGRKTFSAEIKSVWPRRLTVFLDLEQQTSQQTTQFRLWRSEWNRCLYGFYVSLRGRFWMNPIAEATLADNKIYQMATAKLYGFKIPEFIYSNKRSDLIKFADKHSAVALKFMAQEMYKASDGTFKGLYVNKVDSEDLRDFAMTEENPVILQVYIEKAYEVRHTYVDGQHFACRIESQANSMTKVDWRRYNIPETPHEAINSPQAIVESIQAFMRDIGLTYGAFDFIVDNYGNWWYLEVNSAGQWLWVEDLAQLPISAAIASCLMRHNSEAQTCNPSV